MTVGIAAIAQSEDNPYAIVAADRMVTVGDEGGVEYEDTESKIEPFLQTDQTSAVVVGAGRTMLIDEIIDSLHTIVAGEQSNITTARSAMNYVNAAYQQTIRNTISNQVFAPLGYRLEDLQDPDTHIPNEIQATVAEQAQNIRQQYQDRAQLIVAAVGNDGAGIFYVTGSDYTNASDIGYATIGTGYESASLTFIRREYDKNADYREGVFTVLEAKSQSEERQGVGQQMDMILIQAGHQQVIDDTQTLRNKLDEINRAERQARENVIEGWAP